MLSNKLRVEMQRIMHRITASCPKPQAVFLLGYQIYLVGFTLLTGHDGP
jgi:hypothetical protein